MENLVIAGFKLGIIAGGQLGKLLALAASNWDVKTYVLDADEHCPATDVCTKHIRGSHLDFDTVYQFGKQVDLLTFEIENVNIEALRKLKAEGKRIVPDPEILAVIQDKGLQKEFYARHHIPTAPFLFFSDKAAIELAVAEKRLQYPFVQKSRLGGYDGRGVAVISTADDLPLLLDGLSLVETQVAIDRELSVIVARNQRGQVKSFPVVDMVFNPDANLVEKLVCPADIPYTTETEAIHLAEKLISDLNMSGLLAVEFFLDTDGKLWVNECAPRPHNSGHHTIESIITSQYEQMLRAIFNFPLGSTAIKMPSVMINLLGEPGFEGPVHYEGLTESLAIEGVKVHLYGKRITRPYRKMGHVTVLANSLLEASKKADQVRNCLKVKS